MNPPVQDLSPHRDAEKYSLLLVFAVWTLDSCVCSPLAILAPVLIFAAIALSALGLRYGLKGREIAIERQESRVGSTVAIALNASNLVGHLLIVLSVVVTYLWVAAQANAQPH